MRVISSESDISTSEDDIYKQDHHHAGNGALDRGENHTMAPVHKPFEEPGLLDDTTDKAGTTTCTGSSSNEDKALVLITRKAPSKQDPDLELRKQRVKHLRQVQEILDRPPVSLPGSINVATVPYQRFRGVSWMQPEDSAWVVDVFYSVLGTLYEQVL